MAENLAYFISLPAVYPPVKDTPSPSAPPNHPHETTLSVSDTDTCAKRRAGLLENSRTRTERIPSHRLSILMERLAVSVPSVCNRSRWSTWPVSWRSRAPIYGPPPVYLRPFAAGRARKNWFTSFVSRKGSAIIYAGRFLSLLPPLILFASSREKTSF